MYANPVVEDDVQNLDTLTGNLRERKLWNLAKLMAAHGQMTTNARPRLCFRCKKIFEAEVVLFINRAMTVGRHRRARGIMGQTYICQACTSECLDLVVKWSENLRSKLSVSTSESKSAGDMTIQELLDNYRKLPAGTLLGFLRKKISEEDQKIQLPKPIQETLLAGPVGAILSIWDVTTYDQWDPKVFEASMLKVFRAIGKRDQTRQVTMPLHTPQAMVSLVILQLRVLSRVRVIEALSLVPEDIQKIAFPLITNPALMARVRAAIKTKQPPF
jgi:hypothetical protein